MKRRLGPSGGGGRRGNVKREIITIFCTIYCGTFLNCCGEQITADTRPLPADSVTQWSGGATSTAPGAYASSSTRGSDHSSDNVNHKSNNNDDVDSNSNNLKNSHNNVSSDDVVDEPFIFVEKSFNDSTSAITVIKSNNNNNNNLTNDAIVNGTTSTRTSDIINEFNQTLTNLNYSLYYVSESNDNNTVDDDDVGDGEFNATTTTTLTTTALAATNVSPVTATVIIAATTPPNVTRKRENTTIADGGGAGGSGTPKKSVENNRSRVNNVFELSRKMMFNTTTDNQYRRARAGRITLLGLFELRTRHEVRLEGLSELAAAEMAVNHINRRHLLPGYTLELLTNDTQVSKLSRHYLPYPMTTMTCDALLNLIETVN